MGEIQIVVFVVASLVLIVTPGQDMALVMSRSIALGPRAGVATAAGVSTGLLGHTVLAALGLAAVLQASEILFTALKLAGAAYLVYLGIRAFRAAPVSVDDAHPAVGTPLRSLFAQGALSNLANPKIAIFYFSFLPQFLDPGAAHPTLMLFVLGVAFAVLTFLVKAPIGYAAGMLSGWLRTRPAVQTWMNRATGCVLVGLGARLALDQGNA